MGLDAYVRCRCYEEGRCSAPPFDRGLLVLDQGDLSLSVPWEEQRELWARFSAWQRGACAHPGMKLADERVGNWAGYRAFQQTLGELGWAHFPSLREHLPEANGGAAPAAAAPAMKAELARLRATLAGTTTTVLVDAGSGEELYEYVAAYQGIFLWGTSRGACLGFDPRGFFVRRTPEGPDLFRAMELDQEIVPGAGPDAAPTAVFRDRAGPAVLASPFTVRLDRPGDAPPAFPARLRVSTRPTHGDRFDGLLGALERLLAAALATGHPIVWC